MCPEYEMARLHNKLLLLRILVPMNEKSRRMNKCRGYRPNDRVVDDKQEEEENS